MPTPDELESLARLRETLYHAEAAIAYIQRCLKQRAEGNPEGAAHWHNAEAFDYRYPPQR